jgi:hypothetical protein
MEIAKRLQVSLAWGTLIVAACTAPALAQASPGGAPAVAEERDGQHDFDFEFGRWKGHNRRLLKPLTGSNTWVEFDSTVIAKPIWDGRANMDELEADTPSGHMEGLTVRTYNTKTHQWSIYWANQAAGVMALPATVGKFRADGHGDFFDQEEINGQSVIVRFRWTVKNHDTARWEQAFSADGGTTWETNWIADFTREKP